MYMIDRELEFLEQKFVQLYQVANNNGLFDA